MSRATSEPGLLAFTVKADGRLQYRDFLLAGPDRLVVDFADVTRALERQGRSRSEQDPVRKVRLGQFSAAAPKVARLVLDLSKKAPYRIIDGSDGVRIVFGDSRDSRSSRRTRRGLARSRPGSRAAMPAIGPAAAPERRGPRRDRASPDSRRRAAARAGDAGAARPARAGAGPPAEPAVEANYGTACGRTGDLGTPISLDFKDGDLQDIFRLFSDLSGLNVVVNPGVSGKVTLKLNEVPWGRALELILKTNGLGCVLEDNVIRIAPLADAPEGGAGPPQAADEKLLAGELIDYTKRISYAKAGDARRRAEEDRRAVSRGQINVDARTNTLIIRDLPAFVEKARDLIGELDTATPQVEIEARIVVTTRNFTRDLGIQWGFGAEADAALRQHDEPGVPELDRPERRRRPSELGIPAGQRWARAAPPRRRASAARAAATSSTCPRQRSTPASASRWATSSAASTWTWR